MKTELLCFALALALTVTFTHCQKQKKELTPKAPVSFHVPKGKILEHLSYSSNTGQTFAVYLPAQYKKDKRWPVLYFFDAHARGVLPLKLYQTLADEFGFILIGCNNLKNGLPLPEITLRANELIKETGQRFSLHPLRKYIMGFSGGARTAVLTALQRQDIAGVIGCAAGFPRWNQPITHRFNYIAIAGKGDFNYQELKNLNDRLNQSPLPHWFIEFKGKHEWPPLNTTRKALTILQLNAMFSGLTPVDTTLIQRFLTAEQNTIDSLKKDKALLSLANEYNLTVKTLKGLYNMQPWESKRQKLLASKSYLRSKKRQTVQINEEINRQKKIQQAFSRKDGVWLKNEFQHLNKTKAHSPAFWKNQRLLAFMSVLGYLYSQQALKQKNIKAAQTYLNVYRLTDAHNADRYYLQAWLNILLDRIPQAQQSAEKAMEMGLDDPQKIFANPIFSVLQLH